jgi:DNA transformation protein
VAKTNEFVSLVLELIGKLGPASSRSMFGGHGIYIGSQMVAIVADDTLYFKTDEESRGEFEKHGLGPFTYEANGKAYAMSYFRAPDEALESPHEMLPWARLGLAAALRCAARKGMKKKPAAKAAAKIAVQPVRKPKPKSLAKPKPAKKH